VLALVGLTAFARGALQNPGHAFPDVGRALVSPALAAEAAPLDPSKLVKFEGRTYSVTYASSVSNDPIGQAQVVKIAHGRVSTVNVVTTSSGTYSSEATFSPHVLYPGVKVEEVPDTKAANASPAAIWDGVSTFLVLPLDGSTSVTPLGDGGQLLTGPFGTCIAQSRSFICL
jgi:hypothetical protein